MDEALGKGWSHQLRKWRLVGKGGKDREFGGLLTFQSKKEKKRKDVVDKWSES